MAPLTGSNALAVTRISVAAAALIITLENFVTLNQIAAGRITIPFFGWFPPIDERSVAVVFVFGVIGSIALIAGFRSRTAAGSVAVVTVFILLWDQQTYSSHQLLLLCLSAYLAMGRPGASWSLDAKVRGHQESHVSWPNTLIMTQISVVYFFTALAKINPVFLGGDVLRSAMWMPLPDFVYVPLSIGAVAMELFLALALWSRRLVRMTIALGIVLHAGIVVTLDQPLVLFAFALLMVGTYPLFYARAPSSGTHPVHGRRTPAGLH
ncbi:HTTM domain-containing protein [Arthrobacter sp. H14]|uniref:HTTM domain-containing protein n=1 Tax=Arthrobacter sp. H14 TaxID=1312959 RepID=UPI000479B6A7|nr:HTTM domain-containing protein [Arthrobacter sp. H14]